MKVKAKRKVTLVPEVLLRMRPHIHTRVMYLLIAGLLIASILVSYTPEAFVPRGSGIATYFMILIAAISLVAGGVGRSYEIHAVHRQVRIVTDILWIPIIKQAYFTFDEVDSVTLVEIRVTGDEREEMGWGLFRIKNIYKVLIQSEDKTLCLEESHDYGTMKALASEAAALLGRPILRA